MDWAGRSDEEVNVYPHPMSRKTQGSLTTSTMMMLSTPCWSLQFLRYLLTASSTSTVCLMYVGLYSQFSPHCCTINELATSAHLHVMSQPESDVNRGLTSTGMVGSATPLLSRLFWEPGAPCRSC